MPNPNKGRAQVWNFFERDDDKVICGICGLKLAFKGSTTTMRYHLDKKHPMQWGLGNGNGQPNVSTELMIPTTSHNVRSDGDNRALVLANKKTNKTKNKFVTSPRIGPTILSVASKPSSTTHFITELLIKDLLPLREIEKPGFKNLLKYVEPNYSIPTRESFLTSMNRLYEEIKPSVQQLINNAAHISLTAEIWSSCNTQTNVSISAYWITEEWSLTSRLLATHSLSSGYSNEDVASIVHDVLTDFNIRTDKVSAVVQSSCLAFPSSIIDNIAVIPCFAFTLQEAVGKALQISPINMLIDAARRFVGNVKHLSGSVVELAMQQSEIRVSELNLDQDINTQWFSTCTMLASLRNQREILCAMVGDEQMVKASDGMLGPLSENWDLMGEIVDILHPLKTATEVMTVSKNISISSVVPILHGLTTVHLAETAGNSETARSFKEAIRHEIWKWWPLDSVETVDSVPVVASLMDPRYREPLYLTTQQQLNVREMLLQRLLQDRSKHGSVVIITEDGETEESTVVSCYTPPKVTCTLSALEFLLGRHVLVENQTQPNEDNSESELKLYMDPVLNPPAATDCDPMLWWQGNRKRFPMLANLAKRYLCVPTSAAPIGRVFSNDAITFDATRAQLEPDVIDLILFLHSNMQNLK